MKENLKSTRYFIYSFMSVWRAFVFFISMLVIESTLVGKVSHLFDLFYVSFNTHQYNVSEIRVPGQSGGLSSVTSSTKVVTQTEQMLSWPYVAVYVFIVHAGTTLFCFLAGKFACKIRIQVRKRNTSAKLSSLLFTLQIWDVNSELDLHCLSTWLFLLLSRCSSHSADYGWATLACSPTSSRHTCSSNVPPETSSVRSSAINTRGPGSSGSFHRPGLLAITGDLKQAV